MSSEAGLIRKGGAKSGKLHPNFGRPCLEETRKKISAALIGRGGWKHTPEARKKISIGNKGKPKSEEHRKKVAEVVRNFSAETRKKMSASHSGVPLSETHCKNKNVANIGKHSISEERRKSMSAERMGVANPAWKGGVSFEPYCPKFTKEFKERVRSFFGYQCQKCGRVWHDGERKLAIHHVNFHKDACCAEGVAPLFVPLCSGGCHTKTNTNRFFWEYWFTEMINRLYGGKCYLLKEEVL